MSENLFMQPPSNSPPPPSSGYSSAAEFFPMDADSSMNTDDYELYNPRMMAQQSHLRRRQGCQLKLISIFGLLSEFLICSFIKTGNSCPLQDALVLLLQPVPLEGPHPLPVPAPPPQQSPLPPAPSLRLHE